MDREQQNKIKELMENRKRQIKLFEELFIIPIKDNMEMMKKLLRNQESLKNVIKHSEQINKRIKEGLNRK